MADDVDFPPYSDFKSSLTRSSPNYLRIINAGFEKARDLFGQSFTSFISEFKLEPHVCFEIEDESEFPANFT